MLLGSITGMVLLAASSDLITLFVGLELLSIPLYVLCAAELRRRTSLEAGLKYLVIGSVGSATLLYGLALIYGATGAMQFDAISSAHRLRRVRARPTRCCSPASRWPRRASPSRRRWRPSTSGRPTSTRARPRRSRRSWRWRPRPRRSTISLRLFDHALGLDAARLGPRARGAGRGDDRDRQRRRDPAALAQAAARLVERRAGRLPARGRRGGVQAGPPGDPAVPGRLPADERGRVRGGDRARAGLRARRRPVVAREPGPDAAAGSRGR